MKSFKSSVRSEFKKLSIVSIWKIWREILLFFISPNSTTTNRHSLFSKFVYVFSAFIIYFIISIIVVGFIQLLSTANLFNYPDSIIASKLGRIPIGMIIIFGLLIQPFAEEIIFRLGLKIKYNLLFRTIFVLVYLFYRKNAFHLIKKLYSFWGKYYSIIFYSSAIIFAFFHIYNYNFDKISLQLLFLLIPQLVGGLLLGFIRLKIGFIYSYFLHMWINFVFLLIPFFLIYQPLLKYQKSTTDYCIKIEQLNGAFYSNSPKVTERNNSVNYCNFSVKELVSVIYEIDNKLIISNNQELSSTLVNVDIQLLSSKLNVNEILIDALCKAYAISASIDSQDIEVYKIYIEDTLKYNLFASSTKRPETSIFFHDSTIINNGSLGTICYSLNSFYPVLFEVGSVNTVQVNFVLPKVPLETLDVFLLSKFGLKINKELEQKRLLIIN